MAMTLEVKAVRGTNAESRSIYRRNCSDCSVGSNQLWNVGWFCRLSYLRSLPYLHSLSYLHASPVFRRAALAERLEGQRHLLARR